MIKKILALLRKHKQGLGLQRIARELHLLQREKPMLKEKLQTLVDKGLVLKLQKKYFLLPQSQLLRGKVVSVLRGYCFVRPEEGSREDIFVPARHSGGAVQGDLVDVVIAEKQDDAHPEGRIVQIAKLGRERLTGIVKKRWNQLFLLPYDSPSSEEIPLVCSEDFDIEPGMIVEMDRGEKCIKEILGRPDDEGVDIKVVSRKYGFRNTFSPETWEELNEIPAQIPELARSGRKDYRGWTTVTIDGEDAQDFDDAVSINRLDSGGYLLGVHIADVTFYVKPGSSLDRDAYLKGTSVYFPDSSLPMLPEELSHNLCSLQPGEDRLAFSVLLEVGQAGGVKRADFHPSLIRSSARMTYASVFKILEGDSSEQRKYSPYVPDLLLMRELASKLKEKRIEAGSLDFEYPEPRLVYRGGELVAVATFVPNTAHAIIEEFMVAANEAVASYLYHQREHCLYRVHPPPSLEDLQGLSKTMAYFGLSLPPSPKIGIKDLQQLQDQTRDRPDKKIIWQQILKSLKLAVYSPEPIRHFGLGKEFYAHFTSPIRRYPDLLVHRFLKRVLERSPKQEFPIGAAARHCSEQERKAEEAEKELLEWRIFRFLKAKLGEEFSAYITGISKAGVIVELEGYFVNGIVYYQDLGDDYYYSKDEKTLHGRKTGESFAWGDRLQVILASVEPDVRRMVLVPVK